MALFITAATMVASCTAKVSTVGGGAAATASLKILTSQLNGIAVGDVATVISSTGGIAPLEFSVASGSLPDGLSIDPPTGMLYGTIPVGAANSTYAFTIKLSDSTKVSTTKTFEGTVSPGANALRIANTAIASFVSPLAYSYTMVAVGGKTPYVYAVTSGSLPAGLTLAPSTGLITGTVSGAAAGSPYAFDVSVIDADGVTATKSFSGTVISGSTSNFSITTGSIPTPVPGQGYAAAVGVSGGTAPITYSISSGSAPCGLSLNPTTGVFSGTASFASQNTAFNVTVTAQDAAAYQASMTYTGTCGTYTTAMAPSSIPGATPGDSYSALIVTSGGQSPYTYAVTTGTLPAGLTLNSSTGVISGTVNQNEGGLTKTFTITSTDSVGITSSASYAITTAGFIVTTTTSSIAGAQEGVAYTNTSTNLAASGGSSPYTFEYTGTLPSGIGLTSSGAFFGTPAAGSGNTGAGVDYTIAVRARDSLSRVSGWVNLTLNVNVTSPTVTGSTLPNTIVGTSYTAALAATGGRAPYTFALTAGSLPSGMAISGSAITGVTTINYTCPANQFTITATDALGQVSAGSVKCIATVTGVALTTTSLPAIIPAVNYASAVSASGGLGPYTYSASGLPDGISLNTTTGALTGFTNSGVGDYPVYITASDSATPPQSATRLYTMSIRTPLTFSGGSLPAAATGVLYNSTGYQLNASGGQTPYSYVITSGSLPTGISMSSGGLISGTATSSQANNGGNFSISVVATDALGSSSTAQNFTMTVSVPPTLPESKFPVAALNVPYAHDVRRVGGANQFNGTSIASRLTWSASGLPSGLSMGSSTGRISGTPTTNAGSPYTVSVSVTDQYGFSATKNITLKVVSNGKTLDFNAARTSDPCTGGAIGNCAPEVFDIAKLTGTAQQFYVYARNDLTPVNIQIAKISSKGRVPLAGANQTSASFALPSNVMSLGQIRVADIDRDGFRDIAFADSTGRKFCVSYNTGTTDTFGMPTGFSAGNTFCWPIPLQVTTSTNSGAGQYNKPYMFTVRDDLRTANTDASFAGPPDVIINTTNPSTNNMGIPATIMILKNLCSNAQAPCSDSTTYTLSVNTTAGNSTVTLSSGTTAGLKAGFPVIGANLYAGTKITSVVNATSFTVSVAPSATGATTLVSSQRPMMFDGFAAIPASTVSGSPTVTLTQANLDLGSGVAGPIFSGVNIPNATTTFHGLRASASAAGNVTLNGNNASGTGTILLSYPQQQSFTGSSTAASTTITTANTNGIYVGQMIVSPTCSVSDRLFVTGITTNTSITTNIPVGATCASQTFVANGPSAHTPYLLNGANAGVSGSITLDVGWFVAAKPASPASLSSANQCPAIVVSGFQHNLTTTAWLYVVRQTWTGSACSGDFITHTASDEQKIFTGTPYVNGLLAADFNADGLSDIAVSASVIQTNAAGVMYWMSGGGTTLFANPTTSLTTTVKLQSVTNPATVNASAGRLAAFCSDPGVTPCYPSLVVMTGKDGIMGSSVISGLAIFPNQCTNSSCTTPFEQATNPVTRVDYPGPGGAYRNPVIAPLVSPSNLLVTGTTTNGSMTISSVSSTTGVQVGQEISGTNIPNFSFVTGVTASTITINQVATGSGTVSITLPAIPTRNDIAFGGRDISTLTLPYFTVFANNGGSTTDPLKSSQGLFTGSDIGGMKLVDLNSDSKLDLYAFSPGGGMVNSYVSSSGSPTYNLESPSIPTYLSDPTANGCPSGSTNCFPSPVNNWMGVQQGYPMGTNIPTQITMDSADINNDGIADILINGYSSRGIAIARGSATGDVSVPVLYDFGNGTDLRPVSAIFSDLDQDGISDMVAIGYNMSGTQTGFASWFKGNGDGTFANAARIDQIVNGCTDPRSIAAVDLDFDGRPELAVLCFTSQQVWVSRRHTNGTWITASTFNVNSGGGSNGSIMKWGRLTTGSSTGMDLIVGGRDAVNTVRIIAGVTLNVTNAATGSFTLSINTLGNYIRLNALPADIDIADLNMDGLSDFTAVMSHGTSGGNFGGMMVTCVSTAAGACNLETWAGTDGSAANNVLSQDLTGDDLPDLLVSYQYSATASLIYRSISRIQNISY